MNPLLRYGFEKLARDSSEAGIDGVLLTDLCIEEAQASVAKLREQGLDTVFLAAPTSTERRLRLVAEQSSGFIYLVSRTGVTGEQVALSAQAAPLVDSVRSMTGLPLALGFGISTPEQVAEVAKIADGIVVGSAIVKFIENHLPLRRLPEKLEEFTRQLTNPLRAT